MNKLAFHPFVEKVWTEKTDQTNCTRCLEGFSPPKQRTAWNKKTTWRVWNGAFFFSGGDFLVRFPGIIRHKQDSFHGQPARQQVYYNVLSGYPFMSFGENVIVGIQNIVARTSEPGKQKLLSSQRRSCCRRPPPPPPHMFATFSRWLLLNPTSLVWSACLDHNPFLAVQPTTAAPVRNLATMPIRMMVGHEFKVISKTELEVSDECCDSTVIYCDFLWFVHLPRQSFIFICLFMDDSNSKRPGCWKLR